MMTLALSVALSLSVTAAEARKKREPLPPPTTGLIDNVNGLAAGPDGQLAHFTGLLVGQDGRVERRLSRDEKRPEHLIYRYDAQGKTLIPSFVDNHSRVIETGIRLMTLDLSETRSLAEAQAKIADYAQAYPGNKWILGGGWDVARWGMTEQPTVAQLNIAVSDTPTWLISADGRRGWANSAALRLASLKASSSLSGAAKQKMERTAPAPSPKDRDHALDKAQRFYIARGISTVADMGTSIDDWQAYRRAGDRGALRIRIIGYAGGIDNMITIAGPSPSQWLYEDRLRLVGVHLPVDEGADTTRLRNQVSRAAMDGFQVALSPDGSSTRQEAHDTIAEVSGSYTGDRRWRVEGEKQQATALFTSGKAAYNAFAETRIGSLEPGQWADFLILDRDIRNTTAQQTGDAQILEHWISGKRAWIKGETKTAR